MHTPPELEAIFWKTLKSDRTLMLGLAQVNEGHSRPLTAQLDRDDGRGPIWFFTANDADLVTSMGRHHAAIAHFVAKDHELFVSLHGTLSAEDNEAMIDKLWNRFVAAWYPGGKEDPKLQLLRFDPDYAQIWLNDSSLLAGIKILFGTDPKADYQDKVAHVQMRG